MKKRILCINIPHSSRLSHTEGRLKHIYFPIGLAYIIHSIKSNCPQYDVDILDLNFFPFDEAFFRNYISKTYLEDSLPDYIMFGSMSTNYKQVKYVIKVIKSFLPGIKIVCGGTIANIHSRYLLEKSGVDICVLGEGEETVIQLLNGSDELSSVKGIAFLDQGKEYIRTSSRERITKIASIASVYSLFDIEAYIDSFKKTTGYRGMYINASRGCYYSCKFCYRPKDLYKDKPLDAKRVIYRSVEEVIEEINLLVQTYNINAFNLIDELPCADKKWIEDFSNLLLKKNMKLKWACQARINQFSEKDFALLKLMKKAGLVRIGFGLESASKTILKEMGKTGYDPETAHRVIKMVRSFGIKPVVSIIIGYPNETQATLRETVKFLQDNLFFMDSFFMLQPFPGTEVYETHVKGFINEEEWLEKYSHHGDASKLVVNLTEMSDEELERSIQEARVKVRKRAYFNYLRYYSLAELPSQIFNDLYRALRKILKGIKYETV